MLLEYLWLDANQHLRSKIRNITNKLEVIRKINKFLDNKEYIKNVEYKTQILDILYNDNGFHWSYDGSSTGQTQGDNTEVILIPVNLIKHPFLKNSLLLLCSNYDTYGNPVVGNTRHNSEIMFEKYKEKELWFGVEQEFFFFDKETKKPIDWKGSQQIKQGEYYCGVNRSTSIERDIMNKLIMICNEVGIGICGINQEVAPAQWEYQIGPYDGLEVADHLIFAKYILYILCEKEGLYATFHPKPLNGDWNGSGCHINISSKKTRTKLDEPQGLNILSDGNSYVYDGYSFILKAIERMKKDHENFILNYSGKNNNMRLTGNHETSNSKKFTFGIGTRNTSIRIPAETFNKKSGYIEDRRPGSSIDYYKTLSKYIEYFD